MILAAGRGERMRPLSDQTPKPLLKVGGKALIEHLVESLVRSGFTEIVINHAWLGEHIPARLGNGADFGARLHYSPEPPGALDTGGGIAAALPLLGPEPFVAVNGDLWTGFDFTALREVPELEADADTDLSPGGSVCLAHLVLVDNPAYHSRGDFWLTGRAVHSGPAPPPGGEARRLTFAGIGVYCPALFELTPEVFPDPEAGAPRRRRFPLAPLLTRAMVSGQVSGERFAGDWDNVGTPAQLQALDARLTQVADRV